MEVGNRVERIEERDVIGATVISVDGDSIEIEYDEGGSGFWPIESLVLIS